MSSMSRNWILAAAVAAALPQLASAAPTVMDFDALALDTQLVYDPVTETFSKVDQLIGDYYAGFHWGNAFAHTALGTGATYDPPPSGKNVALANRTCTSGSTCDMFFTSDLDITELVVSGMIQQGTLHVYANGQVELAPLDTNAVSGGGSCDAATIAKGWSCGAVYTFSQNLHIRRISFDLPNALGAIDSLQVTTATDGGTVPEPASAALIGLGLLGVAAARRQRKK